MRIKTVKDFEEAIRQGKTKGHTHCQIMCEGCCDRFLSMESASFKKIAARPVEYSVYAVCTGFPIFSNCDNNKLKIVGVTEKVNSSFGTGMLWNIDNIQKLYCEVWRKWND